MAPDTVHPSPWRRLVTPARASRGPPLRVSHCCTMGARSNPALCEKARTRSLQAAERYIRSRLTWRKAWKKARSPIRVRIM